MKKHQETVVSFRLSDKNEVYLKQLGFLTPATGKVAKKKRADDKPNLSYFVNQVLTYVLETEQHALAHGATFEELLHAYWKNQTIMIAREYDELNRQMKYAQARRAETESMMLEREQQRAERNN